MKYFSNNDYTFLRQNTAMQCVDGVPVLTDEPNVILGLRGNEGVAPHTYWICGGRTQKGVSELEILSEKFDSEFGLKDIKITSQQLIGMAHLHFSQHATENRFLSTEGYDVETPTHIYAVPIGTRVNVESILRPSDGHIDATVFEGASLFENELLHPSVQKSCIAALDYTYGLDWRPKKQKKYQMWDGKSKDIFIPVSLRCQK